MNRCPHYPAGVPSPSASAAWCGECAVESELVELLGAYLSREMLGRMETFLQMPTCVADTTFHLVGDLPAARSGDGVLRISDGDGRFRLSLTVTAIPDHPEFEAARREAAVALMDEVRERTRGLPEGTVDDAIDELRGKR